MNWWRQSAKRFLNFKERERKLIFYTSQVMIAWLGFVLVIEPLMLKATQLTKQNQQTQQQITQLQQQSALIQRALSVDINQEIQSQIQAQQQVQSELTQRIQQLTGSYISAQQMLDLLQDLLVKMPKVQLVALENLPVKPIQLQAMTQGQTPEKTASALDQPLLFKHTTQLVFRGDFNGLQQLLGQLQQLSWQLHWVKLQYKVLEYPQAELQLELETVSESANYVQI